jgi:hypothetical protein
LVGSYYSFSGKSSIAVAWNAEKLVRWSETEAKDWYPGILRRFMVSGIPFDLRSGDGQLNKNMFWPGEQLLIRHVFLSLILNGDSQGFFNALDCDWTR